MPLFGPQGGGGGISSFSRTQRDALTPTNGQAIFNTDERVVQVYDSTLSLWRNVGDPLAINYITNYAGQSSNTQGWATYADAAGTAPVDGTGGSPNVTFSLSTSSPLRGIVDYNFAKDAANRQGQGVSYDFFVEAADRARVLSITFDYEVVSGTYADGDMTIWVYDITNATLIQPSGSSILNTILPTQKNQVTFQTSSNGSNYRIILHVSSTSASAYTLAFDNFSLGPQISAFGPIATDLVTFTPTGSFNTNTTYTGRWRRVGDKAQYVIRASFSGAANAATFTANLFPGHVIDTNKLTNFTSADLGQILGVAVVYDASGGMGVNQLIGHVLYSSTTAVTCANILNNDTATHSLRQLTNTSIITFANGDYVEIAFEVPIAGWSSSMLVSSDASTRVVAAIISGDPASATSGNPIIVPTVGTDTHAAYNNTTGRYTVPVAGIYRMHGALTSASAATTLSIYKNAVSTALAGSLDSNGEATYTGLVNCIAGDIIDIRPGGTVDATSMTLNIERISGPAQIAASENISARYTTTAGQTIDNTNPTVVYGTRDFDSHNAYNASTGEYTIPSPGKYEFGTGLTCIQNNSTFSVFIYKNGVLFSLMDRNNTPGNITYGVSCADFVSCIAGDIITIRATSTVSTTLTTTAGFNHFRVNRIGQ